MRLFLKYQRPALWWALLILILCSISFGSIGNSPLFSPGFDKLVHCGLFFVLSILIGYGFIRQKGWQQFKIMGGVNVLLLAIVYGAIIEILQRFIFTWRSAEWDDLFADAVGIGMAIFGIGVVLAALTHEKD
jgi:VanZ family protein